MTRTVNRKTVAGISLRKIIGRNYHRWACSMAGYHCTFTPYLGLHNGKVNGWKFTIDHPGVHGHCLASGHGNTLKQCVIDAQHYAHELRRISRGLKPSDSEYLADMEERERQRQERNK